MSYFLKHLKSLKLLIYNRMKKKLVISTGAGMSAESGIPTFRDIGGLWENYPVMEVCSADGFRRNPALIHKFYNDRRHQYGKCKPNDGHRILKELEKEFDVEIITQNVDNLHEQAGSAHVLHLHGEIMKIRSISNPDYVEELAPGADTDVNTRGRNGDLMRPHIVFFQEPVPNMEKAVHIVRQADIFVVIGTSLVVYPAAALIQYVRPGTPIYYIDPNPGDVSGIPNVTVIRATASEGLRRLREILSHQSS